MRFVSGFRGQALCTIAVVMGGKSLAKQISEKLVNKWNLHLFPNTESTACQFCCLLNLIAIHKSTGKKTKVVTHLMQVALSGGVLFIVFSIKSFFLTKKRKYWIFLVYGRVELWGVIQLRRSTYSSSYICYDEYQD